MSDLNSTSHLSSDTDDTGPIDTQGEAESTRPHHARIPHMIRLFAVPILLAWVFITVLVNMVVPRLEVVGEAHSAPMAPLDAPSMKSMMLLGHNFKEFDSNSTIMIVLESQGPLGNDAHRYYDNLIRQLQQDHTHIQHIQDFWGDRLTAAGAQSADGKGAYVMLNLAGNQGTTQANQSVEAVRKVIENNPTPPGAQGLRHRTRRVQRRLTRHRKRKPGHDHPVHPGGDRDHAVAGLPLHRHYPDPAVHDPGFAGVCARSRGDSGV